MINTFLFDLDGTLLPMDADLFMKIYFGELSKKAVELKLEPNLFIKSVWAGTEAMMKNDGSVLNEIRFWEVFSKFISGGDRETLENTFLSFYQNEFEKVKESTFPTPLAKKSVDLLKEKGYKLVLATNPLFPSVATQNRIKWAGLDIRDFELITTYENSKTCKPNPKYYETILAFIEKNPKECMMVGNDANEDLAASFLGIDTYLITDNLINKTNLDLNQFKHGNFESFYEFIKGLPNVK